MVATIIILAILLILSVCLNVNYSTRLKARQTIIDNYVKLFEETHTKTKELQTELEKEKNDNKFFMRRIVEQQNDMALLRKTMK
jgi:hypothetical protein